MLTKEGGLSDQGARALISRWKNIEFPGGPTGANSIGGGHFGIAQWNRERRRTSGLGNNTDFDAQLHAAIREFNGSDANKYTTEAARIFRDKTASANEAARAASLYERAEGFKESGYYTDRYQGRVLAGMAGVFTGHGPVSRKEFHKALAVIPGVGVPRRGTGALGVNGTPYDAHGNYVGYASSADTVMGGSAAARRAALMHSSQKHILNDSHASHDNSQHTSSSSINVGNVNIQTAATDAHGIAADMRVAMERGLLTTQSNYGLA